MMKDDNLLTPKDIGTKQEIKNDKQSDNIIDISKTGNEPRDKKENIMDKENLIQKKNIFQTIEQKHGDKIKDKDNLFSFEDVERMAKERDYHDYILKYESDHDLDTVTDEISEEREDDNLFHINVDKDGDKVADVEVQEQVRTEEVVENFYDVIEEDEEDYER